MGARIFFGSISMGLILFISAVFAETPGNESIQLPQKTAIELVFISVKPDKLNTLLNEYFPKVMPIVTEYGGKRLAVFNILAHNTAMPAQNMGVFSWPTVESFKRISKDSRVLPLLPIRNGTLNYINEANFFQLSGPSVAMEKGRFYLFLMSMDAQKVWDVWGRKLATLVAMRKDNHFPAREIALIELKKDPKIRNKQWINKISSKLKAEQIPFFLVAF